MIMVISITMIIGNGMRQLQRRNSQGMRNRALIKQAIQPLVDVGEKDLLKQQTVLPPH